MKDKKEYNQVVGAVLKDLRQQAGLTKAKMADRLFIDERTYSRYEAGESAPSLSEFLALLDLLNAPALPTIMRYLYPDTYGQLAPEASDAAVRKAVADYVLLDMSSRDVRQLAYILHGPHGSPLRAQLQLFCALDHLPMDVRLAIAKLTLNAWEIESCRGGVINKNNILPDVELLREAIIKAQQAVMAGRNSYNTNGR